MFDRLDDILIHYEELMLELNNPSVAEDQNRFRKLMKEQADLAPLVDTYKEYKQAVLIFSTMRSTSTSSFRKRKRWAVLTAWPRQRTAVTARS